VRRVTYQSTTGTPGAAVPAIVASAAAPSATACGKLIVRCPGGPGLQPDGGEFVGVRLARRLGAFTGRLRRGLNRSECGDGVGVRGPSVSSRVAMVGFILGSYITVGLDVPAPRLRSPIMWQGRVVSVHIAPEIVAPLQVVPEVRALLGRGWKATATPWAAGTTRPGRARRGSGRWSTPQSSAHRECTAPGFLDTSGGCLTPATIVDPGVIGRSRAQPDHRYAANAAARAAAGVRWPSRSMSHSAL
jgi:hypothetical protein